ncbi:heme-binding protein [Pseudooceanicola sediminis]|uniref:Heme-binding protein n=1 Tax=Pseudooceanicola sediminis TaxID=2211117 RepID=A0A399J8N5_9RHOB|nr:heme-binding protein [Pseudooceanicola sediminis]KAA2315402.1 heme-binding protein [Puniceibacterium sp. HSS470]RII40392.1 heme-binding protein [Pseudooceanicola sediminis]|tara:strand:+ start:93114 stop:93536 length:423 start_codon:yes stop_codon:yes gene_type:complete
MISVQRLDAADAQLMLAGARACATEIGVPMCIAITDEGGNLVAFERMDGGKVTSITIAIDKSFTASGAKRATHDYGAASQPGAPAYGIASAIGGRLMVVGGGLPVMVDGACVGGIGVSSGTADQDMQVARAGVDAFLASL